MGSINFYKPEPSTAIATAGAESSARIHTPPTSPARRPTSTPIIGKENETWGASFAEFLSSGCCAVLREGLPAALDTWPAPHSLGETSSSAARAAADLRSLVDGVQPGNGVANERLTRRSGGQRGPPPHHDESRQHRFDRRPPDGRDGSTRTWGSGSTTRACGHWRPNLSGTMVSSVDGIFAPLVTGRFAAASRTGTPVLFLASSGLSRLLPSGAPSAASRS